MQHLPRHLQRLGITTQINVLFVAFFFTFFCVKLHLFRMFLCHDPHIPRFFRANARTQKPGYVQTQLISGVTPPSEQGDEQRVL
jgi:hypothetical protein